MRQQIGHSPRLTLEVQDDGKHVYRSYETPILVTDAQNTILFADTRFYTPATTRHQRQLRHVVPEYALPEKRERVEYEYSLHLVGENSWGSLYSPRYRAKDNPYDPWHEVHPGMSYDWDTAYHQLYNAAVNHTGVYNEQVVHDNYVGTF